MRTSAYVAVIVVCWGLWQVSQKLSVRHMSPAMVQLTAWYIYSAVAPLVFLAMKARGDAVTWNAPGIAWTLLSAVLASAGSYAFLSLVRTRPLAASLSLTQLYQIVTFGLCWAFLGERLTPLRAVGAALAVAGAVCMNL